MDLLSSFMFVCGKVVLYMLRDIKLPSLPVSILDFVLQNSFSTDSIHIKRKVLSSNIVLDVQYSYGKSLVKY